MAVSRSNRPHTDGGEVDQRTSGDGRRGRGTRTGGRQGDARMGASGHRRSGAETRERILDVALELFTEQGYDKTSLRDIAERLGITKAALYYHFERKEDMLIELHLRLHDLARETFGALDDLPDDRSRADAWPAILDRFIDQAIDNQQLLLLHVRNQSALEAAGHDDRHQAENEDLQQRLTRILASSEIPLERRVRISCAIGAVVVGLVGFGRAFGEVPLAELVEQVRGVAREILDAP